MTKFGKEYDVIVIGGGINGLTCAAYLQKAGLKVAIFERRDEVGTHCATEEVMYPGVKVNLHASGLLPHVSPPYEDLELERFGLEMLTSSEWGYFHPFKDKTAVLFHSWDAKKQYEAWKRISEKDAEVFRNLVNYFGPLLSEYLELLFYATPTVENLARMNDLINKCPGIPKDWAEMSGIELADILFEDERIKTACHTVGIEVAFDPWYPGVGASVPIFTPLTGFLAAWNFTAKSGSHGIPHALARCFLHYGGEIFQGCPVEKIIIERGEAKGIALSKNAIYPEAEIYAKRAIVSDLTCYPTFIDLIGEENLSPEVALAARSYDYNGQILFTNYWVLSEPPRWINAEWDPAVERAYIFNFGLESVKDVERLYTDLIAGRLPDPPICAGGCVQGYAMADPTQAPEGQYTLMTWADVPYDLRRYGGPEKWDDIREEYGDKIENLLNEYMYNLKKAKIRRYVNTPLDIYRRNPSAIKGTWSGGPAPYHQFYHNRPFPGCGAPRTPIGKLYLSNSIWPVCGTWLGSGYNAASTVAEDLGVRDQDWWIAKAHKPYVNMLKRRGIEFKVRVD
jgi:phytoene dehydrogenase-like protein